MPEYFQKEKIERKDIIIEIIREIGKKALIEFKGGYSKTVIHGDWQEEVYIPDSRKEYIQGVEFLSDMLLPDFDKDMNDAYKKIQDVIDGALKKYEKEDTADKKDSITKEEYVVIKLKQTRNLFRALMIFLNRIKFFKKKMVIG